MVPLPTSGEASGIRESEVFESPMSWVSLPYDPQKEEFSRKLRKEMTPPEKRLWYDLLAKKKPEWRRQKVIGPFIADFYCPEKLLVIEVDGKTHEEQKDYDNERDIYMNPLEIQVIRISARDILENFIVYSVAFHYFSICSCHAEARSICSVRDNLSRSLVPRDDKNGCLKCKSVHYI